MIKAPMCLQELRRKLYAKAKAEPHWRFWGLCHLIRRIGLINRGTKQTGERSAGMRPGKVA